MINDKSLLNTACFDRSNVPPLLVFEILGFLLSVSVLHFKQFNNTVL